ncbi:hypothetical protein ZIOFF_073564 [Zingiber officinale]|uniref:Reverse transcriptase Ty1/copia-type domain-containing protein n=1 Tax=Zingiber officinale TaxID=94328 RepID=A0A8J5ESS5_ZINOF|nr:hypothetical protein ZIOFF_073564 [Zingiber officinale]
MSTSRCVSLARHLHLPLASLASTSASKGISFPIASTGCRCSSFCVEYPCDAATNPKFSSVVTANPKFSSAVAATPKFSSAAFIKSKSDELALMNAPLDIEDLTLKILHGLDDDYKELACAIQPRDTAISYEELHEKLLNHEAHLAACKDTQITLLATTHSVSQSVDSSRRQPYPPIVAHPPNSARPIASPAKSPPTEPLLVEPLPFVPAATIAPPAPTPPVLRAPSTNSHPMVTRGITMYLLVYVDDLILIRNNANALQGFINQLGVQFSIKDLGTLSYFLGVDVVSSPGGLCLSQKKYLLDILTKTYMAKSKLVQMPMATSTSLHLSDDSPPTDAILYLQAVDWAGDIVDRTPTGAYIMFLGSNLISWSSIMQGSIARLSTKAKYRVIASTAAELQWSGKVRVSLADQLADALMKPLPNARIRLLCSKIGVSTSPPS